MTTPQNPLVAAAVVGNLVDDENDTNEAGTPVGAADAEADAVRSGAEGDPLTGGERDTDGVPVGEADHEADKTNSGVRRG